MTTATGTLGRIVNWVGDAWSDIQTEHDDWDFMRSSNILGGGVSFATVAGQASYALGTGAGTVGVLGDNFGKWALGTFRNFTTTTGYVDEIPMGDIPFDLWRDGYMTNASRNVQTRPSVVAIGPDKSICLGPPPNGLYTVTGDYFRAPTEMAENTDTPTGLPTRFHMLIVYLAMKKYGSYAGAPEVYQRGAEEATSTMGDLVRGYAPGVSLAGTLV